MFPLGTVLFPHVHLPLHVFEPRYQALVKDCLRARNEFGVVLIERGHEVGGGDDRFATGTVARITEWAELGDGRWVLDTVGTRRVRVATWLPDDPYPVALAADLADTAPRDHDLFVRAEQAVRRALALKAEMNEPAARADAQLDDDPSTAAWQLTAIAPLSPMDQQRLLEQDDADDRLRLLTELAGDAADVLAYRLSGG
ncbi:MAG TPA: LON peptidase substrate-binding domain-containing protein [Acidimicrobiales bacterium]|jgi:Lon protease-like protein|nr:LON peptidase substrate-binding domain-containing protein [Acidimicrobiales bacterium]